MFSDRLLAPAHLLKAAMLSTRKDRISVAHISELFDINFQAARIRKEVLERVDRRARGKIRPLPEDFTNFLRKLSARQGRKLSSLDLDDARRRGEAAANGYEREACGQCGKFTLIRCDMRLTCDSCGYTTGSP
jgi:hypothetical protein